MSGKNASHAVVEVLPSGPVEIPQGGTVPARLRLRVRKGYHVQANPASGDFLVPLRVELRARRGVRPGPPIYPPGRPYRLPGMESDWNTYTGTVTILVPLHAGPLAQAGACILTGTVHYQACNARSCLFPASVPVSVEAKVIEAPASCGSRSPLEDRKTAGVKKAALPAAQPMPAPPGRSATEEKVRRA